MKKIVIAVMALLALNSCGNRIDSYKTEIVSIDDTVVTVEINGSYYSWYDDDTTLKVGDTMLVKIDFKGTENLEDDEVVDAVKAD